MFLLCLGCLLQAQAQNLEAVLEPESYIEYYASDDADSWRGRAPIEELVLHLAEDNLRHVRLELSIDPARFNSGNFVRDGNARRSVFQTQRYPRIHFEASQVSPNVRGFADGDARELSISGTLTMHGHSRPLQVRMGVRRRGDELFASGDFSVLLSDFSMTRPRFFNRQVHDEVRINVVIRARLQPR